jgi:hypothetical protein
MVLDKQVCFLLRKYLVSFFGSYEILCGTLKITLLFARIASIPLIIIMFVALLTSKIKTPLRNAVLKSSAGAF